MLNKLFFITFFSILGVFSSCNKDEVLKSKKEFQEPLSTLTKDISNSSSLEIYCILDNSGSTAIDGLKKVPLSFFSDLKDFISEQSRGRLWINFIDENANNNTAIQIDIPYIGFIPLEPKSPKRSDFISNAAYAQSRKRYMKNVLPKYETEIKKYKSLKATYDSTFNGQIVVLERYLQNIYSHKPRLSDCFGAINSAIKTLDTSLDSDKYIVCISDLKHDANDTQLVSFSSNHKFIRIHHSSNLPDFEWISKDISYISQLEETILSL